MSENKQIKIIIKINYSLYSIKYQTYLSLIVLNINIDAIIGDWNSQSVDKQAGRMILILT